MLRNYRLVVYCVEFSFSIASTPKNLFSLYSVLKTEVCFLPLIILQAGCPKLKELFVANLLLHSTPISSDVVSKNRNIGIGYISIIAKAKKGLYNFLQEQNGFPQLETLCLACGSLAGVPRTDRFLYRFVHRNDRNLS